MECKVMDKAIPACEVLFDNFEECPVDYDFVLPDYLADIAAILKCSLTPAVQTRQLSGDRLRVDGTVTVHVLYLDEARKCARSCEFSQPFDCHFTVKNLPANAVIQLDTHANYINCRATGPRKLSLHGAFTVKCRVTAETGVPVVGDMQQSGWYANRRHVWYAVPAGSAEKTFTVSEITELGAGKPAMQAIVRSQATPLITDCKLIQGKAIVKGDLLLHTLYAVDAELGIMQTVEHHLPFSQLIDVDGLTEDWHCECDAQVISCEVHMTANQGGENRLLDINVRLTVGLVCTKSGEEDAVQDAYAVTCPLLPEYSDVQTERLHGIRQSLSTIQQTMEMPGDGDCETVDVWCELASVNDRCEDGVASVEGRLTLCLLAKDAAGTLSYYERPWEFTLGFDDVCAEQQTRIKICRLDYTQTGSQLELRAELSVCRRVFETQHHRLVASIAADEHAAFEPDAAALKIYYAGKGESVWDIAKRYHTPVDAVAEENGLTADKLPEDTMLLIPMC